MSYPIRIITRVVLELEGPCSIGTGEESADSDMPFVVDASGLPALPGSSLAGLLRATVRDHHGQQEAAHWFGAPRASTDPDASRVCLSWAHVHNKEDQPVDGRLAADDWSEFLRKTAGGEIRDHVRTHHRGAADDGGKFDRQLLYAGTRFTFELEIIAEENEREDAEAIRDELLAMLDSPATRLGSGKHSGFGAFGVVRAKGRTFDLRDGDDFTAYTDTSAELDEEVDFPPIDIPQLDAAKPDHATIDVELKPETFFLVGGGDVIEGADEVTAKIAPVTTHRIKWRNGVGTFRSSEMNYLPATSIKGAISHRVAFHANRLLDNFATDGEQLDEHCGEDNPVIRNLFGFCRDEAVDDATNSGIGRVVIDDVRLPGRHGTKTMAHISTDPFTGGVRHGFLFTEEAFTPGGPPIEFTISVEQPEQLGEVERKALYMALDDLTSGRLALGSGAGRGNGRFQGDFDYPAELQWDQEVSA